MKWMSLVIFQMMLISVEAQVMFQKVYTNPGISYGIYAHEREDSYVVIGVYSDTLSNYGNEWGYYDGVVFLRLDTTGTIEFTRKIMGRDGGRIAGRAATATTDGGYLIVASENHNNEEEILLIKTDEYANIQWTTTYMDGSRNIPTHIAMAPSGQYLVSGRRIDGINESYFVLEADAGGQIRSSYDYSIGNTYQGAMIPCGDGYIACTNPFVEGADREILVMRSDPDPEKQFANIYGESSLEFAKDICTTADGGFVVAGITDSYFDQRSILLMKILSNGEMGWTKVYTGISNPQLADIKACSDGGFMVVPRGTASQRGMLMKVDSNGEIEWARRYGQESGRFNEVIEANDGGFLATGDGGNDITLVKTNAIGQSWCFEQDIYMQSWAVEMNTRHGGEKNRTSYESGSALLNLDSYSAEQQAVCFAIETPEIAETQFLPCVDNASSFYEDGFTLVVNDRFITGIVEIVDATGTIVHTQVIRDTSTGLAPMTTIGYYTVRVISPEGEIAFLPGR